MLYRAEISGFFGLSPSSFIYASLEGAVLFLSTMTFYWLIKSSLLRLLRVTTDKFDSGLLRVLSKNRVLRNLVLVVPFAFMCNAQDIFLNSRFSSLFGKTMYGASCIALLMLCFSVLNVLTETYGSNMRMVERLPVKPILQILKILAFIIAIIVIAANFMNQTPIYILSGIGAVSAVVMFIFKDTLQSLVAAFQITLHRSVKPGDWIEVPKHQVDGSVVDISLSVVSVRNWDNTTTVIPTSSLLTESFKNWTTMHRDGRRIKRSINIDVSSVRALTVDEVSRLKSISILSEYLEDKINQIEIPSELSADGIDLTNGRSVTNIGTFRKYIEFYLKRHESIRNDQLLVVRQLPTGSEGLPIELYCFTSKTGLADYEEIQSDIFDHLYSVVAVFGLRVYQSPSGADFTNIIR